MAGPTFDIIASLREGSNREAVSKTISEIVRRYGFGIVAGIEAIRRRYDQEGKLLDQLAMQVENPLVFSITTDPKASEAWEIFERQLHPLFADPEKAKILTVLTELWALEEIESAVSIVMEVDTEFLPRYEMTFEEFLRAIAEFQSRQQHTNVGRGGGLGIFKVLKNRNSHVSSAPARL